MPNNMDLWTSAAEAKRQLIVRVTHLKSFACAEVCVCVRVLCVSHFAGVNAALSRLVSFP